MAATTLRRPPQTRERPDKTAVVVKEWSNYRPSIPLANFKSFKAVDVMLQFGPTGEIILAREDQLRITERGFCRSWPFRVILAEAHDGVSGVRAKLFK